MGHINQYVIYTDDGDCIPGDMWDEMLTHYAVKTGETDNGHPVWRTWYGWDKRLDADVIDMPDADHPANATIRWVD